MNINDIPNIKPIEHSAVETLAEYGVPLFRCGSKFYAMDQQFVPQKSKNLSRTRGTGKRAPCPDKCSPETLLALNKFHAYRPSDSISATARAYRSACNLLKDGSTSTRRDLIEYLIADTQLDAAGVNRIVTKFVRDLNVLKRI